MGASGGGCGIRKIFNGLTNMQLTITNGRISAQVDSFGAELKSLRHEGNDIDYLWNGDASVWTDTAPFLFPVVARQLDDQYVLNGETLTMPMHGFAKDSNFTVLECATDKIKLELRESAETLQWYPFAFCVTSEFVVNDDGLSIVRTVTNTDEMDMPYSLGEHPGYRIPMVAGDTLEDYYLEFSAQENAQRWYLDDEIIAGNEPGLCGDILLITPHLFDRGALIYKGLVSDKVTLRSKNHAHSVTVSLNGWNYLGIWAKPGAAYVCIEPWNGLASSKWSEYDIWKKEGIRRLAPGQSESFVMKISLT